MRVYVCVCDLVKLRAKKSILRHINFGRSSWNKTISSIELRRMPVAERRDEIFIHVWLCLCSVQSARMPYWNALRKICVLVVRHVLFPFSIRVNFSLYDLWASMRYIYDAQYGLLFIYFAALCLSLPLTLSVPLPLSEHFVSVLAPKTLSAFTHTKVWQIGKAAIRRTHDNSGMRYTIFLPHL